MKERAEDWVNWATCMNPQTDPLPDPWEEQLTDFQKCIMLKVFRPEKLMFAFKNYVRDHMGQFYIEAQTVTMDGIY
jgi:dynein heavy chain